MERKTLQELDRVAELYPDKPPATEPMSKRVRLERWAWLLEQLPNRPLSMLLETERRAPVWREKMNRPESPIAIAYGDPVLRAAGLEGDRYGDAKRFFELDDWQLHHIVCGCHHGASDRAQMVAERVRSVIPRPVGPGLLARAWRSVIGS